MLAIIVTVLVWDHDLYAPETCSGKAGRRRAPGPSMHICAWTCVCLDHRRSPSLSRIVVMRSFLWDMTRPENGHSKVRQEWESLMCKALSSTQESAPTRWAPGFYDIQSPNQYIFATMSQALCWAPGDNGDHYRHCSSSHGAHRLTENTDK